MIYVSPNGSVAVASTASFVTPNGSWRVASVQGAGSPSDVGGGPLLHRNLIAGPLVGGRLVA